MIIKWRSTDLWNDSCGWSENAACVREGEIEVSDDLSDMAISRAIKSAAGWTNCGRRDSWCCSDFGPWRDGVMGLYADIVD